MCIRNDEEFFDVTYSDVTRKILSIEMFIRNDQWYCTGIVSIAKMKCFVLYNERALTSCERVLICSSLLQEFLRFGSNWLLVLPCNLK